MFKSSSCQVWPILCNVNGLDIYVVCLYCGSSKPEPVNDFLEDFVNELKELKANNHIIEGREIVIKAFTCDAPARSFLKGTVGHTSYFACERCTIKGRWVQGRVTYNDKFKFECRNDKDFSQMKYENHQKKISPLISVDIPCVSYFALDYMHLVCLGVTRRILNFLRKGPAVCRLSYGQIDRISLKLINLKDYIPSNFSRKPRSLVEMDRWKATEFRQFLLYTGPVVLKGILNQAMYHHFLSLRLGIAILLNNDADHRNWYLQYARQLLEFFVDNASRFYGDTFTVYNVHNLIHLADDAQKMNCSLDDVSCFKFENFLHFLKKSVKNANNPISQITKRITEISSLNKEKCKSSIILTTKEKDRYGYLKDCNVVKILNIENDTLTCELIKKKYCDNFFDVPDNSSNYGIYLVDLQKIKTRQVRLSKSEIERKGICLPLDENKYVLFPLLHEENY